MKANLKIDLSDPVKSSKGACACHEIDERFCFLHPKMLSRPVSRFRPPNFPENALARRQLKITIRQHAYDVVFKSIGL